MKIGLITGEYPPMEGGIADYTQILGRELVALGHEVFILTHADAATYPDDIHVTAEIRSWNEAFFGRITRWGAEHGLDVVNLQFQTAAYRMSGLIHFLPSLFRKIPFITTFHDLRVPYLFPKAGRLRTWVVYEMARRSAGVIVTNHGDEKTLRDRFPALRLARIPLGATVPVTKSNRREEIRLHIGATRDTLVVAHFGFVNAVKGVDTLFRAAKTALDNGVPVQLLMLGGRTGSSDTTNLAYVQEMDELARSLYIHPYWTGFLSDADIGAYFAAADLVALPFKDGVSLRRTSLQAALSYGCPIVTTPPQDTDLPEFEDGKHLLYVPVDDKFALASAFHRLWKDPALRQKLGENAEAAAQQFRWDAIARQMVEFYSAVKTTFI